MATEQGGKTVENSVLQSSETDSAIQVIGHQKGRETNEKIKRNFGMPKPEGYRKALRLMQMAERFKMPIITFIDTPGRITSYNVCYTKLLRS